MIRSAKLPTLPLLGLIILLALILRVLAIRQQPLWGDEGLTLAIARWPAGTLLTRPVDPSPALYYLLDKWLVPVNAGTAAVRGISLVAGTATVAAVFALARVSLSARASLLAAAFAALSFPLIDYSQEARAYALLVLLVTLSGVGVSRWIGALGSGQLRMGALLLFSSTTVLAFYTHFIAVFWIAPAVSVCAFLTFRHGSAGERRGSTAAAGLMLFAAIPELLRLFRRVAAGGGFFWLKQESPTRFLAILSDSFLPKGLWSNGLIAAHDGVRGLLLIGAASLLLWRVARHQRLRWEEGRGLVIACGILLVSPLLIWLFGYLVVPIFMPRTILIAIPAFVIVVSAVLERESPWASAAVLAALAASLLFSGTKRHQEDWTPIIATLKSGLRRGDVLITCPRWKYAALRHTAGEAWPVPAIAPMWGREFLLDSGSADWVDRFFRTHEKAHASASEHHPPKVVRMRFNPNGRAWLVDSECDSQSLQDIRSWVGVSSWKPMASVRAGKITVWRSSPLPHQDFEVWAVAD
jgi:hypothetical protein